MVVSPLFMRYIEGVHLSADTADLLASLDALSNNSLAHREDLGVLLEIAVKNDAAETLDKLSFFSKFIVKAHGIMRRIGSKGEGYSNVAREFTAGVENVKGIMTALLEHTPPETRSRFSGTYLDMTPESLQQLISLCNDLSWYKNWLIDHSGASRR